MAKRTPHKSSGTNPTRRKSHIGLRLVQLWVINMRAPGFKKECRRQFRVVARSERLEQDVQDRIESNLDTEDWVP